MRFTEFNPFLLDSVDGCDQDSVTSREGFGLVRISDSERLRSGLLTAACALWAAGCVGSDRKRSMMQFPIDDLDGLRAQR